MSDIINTNLPSKRGYKGFDKNLKCKNYQYSSDVLNIEIIVPDSGKTGLHFCSTLSGCFDTYSNNGENVFAEVESFGTVHTNDCKLFATNCIKIVKILTKDEISEIVNNENKAYVLANRESVFNIELVTKLQQTYPNLIIGGSIGLFLQGIVLDRIETDLDIILPYWDNIFNSEFLATINKSEKNTLNIDNGTHIMSGADFDEQGTICHNNRWIKYDLVVSPKTKFKVVTYNDFKFKVIDWKDTLEYKLKYAKSGNEKHNNDLIKMLNLNKNK
jgi:hypothetical protein